MTSRYAALSREELATLVPELLLIGQLIDRSGMAHCISAWGRDEMLQIAIEEWAASSPLYTKRMQKALKYEGVDVITIFKGLQLDIGAPPQFMDFRYTVHDRWHGEFHLDHCGALHGRRADGRGLRPRHVPRHRGPHLRRHRAGHQPQGPGPAHPPAAEDAVRPAPPLQVDGDHRRVLPGGAVHPGDGHRCREPRPLHRAGPDRPERRRHGRLFGRSCCPTSTSERSRIRRWSGSPTRSACRCTCWCSRSRSRCEPAPRTMRRWRGRSAPSS